jgi:OmpA-OmpF porin, OOP family
LKLEAIDYLHKVILENKMKNLIRVAKVAGTLAVVGCAVMNSTIALAADSGWIVGLSAGQSRSKIDDARITASLQGAGLSTTSMSDDNVDTGYKIFAGYQFNKNISLEGGYFNLGRFNFLSTTNPAGALAGKIQLQGLNLDVVGILPIVDKFSVFGRAGLQYAQTKDDFTGSGAVVVLTNASPSKNSLGYKFGLGAQYDFTESVGLRGEFERFRINDAVGSHGDVNMYTIGLVVKLGEKKLSPAPVLVIVPVKEKTQQYCSILDIQFNIKKEGLQREDKEKLAVLGTYMTKYPDTTAVIEGHSDNVGTEEHNMTLSQQRAESVVSYLMDGFHIAPSRLQAIGYGETRPIASNSTEEGKRQNRRIDAVIACSTDIEGLHVKPAKLTMAMEMEFDQNKANIKPQYADELANVAAFLKANPAVSATVEGHADDLQANTALAMQISQDRAQNVVNYLVDKLGVSREQLSTSAFGASRRFAYNTSLEGAQKNRRVNIIFNYSK